MKVVSEKRVLFALMVTLLLATAMSDCERRAKNKDYYRPPDTEQGPKEAPAPKVRSEDLVSLAESHSSQ